MKPLVGAAIVDSPSGVDGHDSGAAAVTGAGYAHVSGVGPGRDSAGVEILTATLTDLIYF